MGKVYLCWICSSCGSENRVCLDPWEDEDERTWAEDATLNETCPSCGIKHNVCFNVSVEVDQKPQTQD